MRSTEIAIAAGILAFGAATILLVASIEEVAQQAEQPEPAPIECASWGWDRLPGCGE